MSSNKVAIGIDLGTTYSCVGAFINGNVEIIANDQGNRTTPSYVAFTDSERLIGDSAKNQSSSNPQNTIFDAKRLIGRQRGDASIEKDKEHWPFKINYDNNGKPQFEVVHQNETKHFYPEEISAMVLTKMKTIAESFLGTTVTDAVITVPAYFNDSQRQSTKDAGHIAGLNVLRMINEPTAAAIAYGITNTTDKEKTILVFDFGGGTLDVSILTLDDQVFEVKSTSGNTHLGGEDIDNTLVKHCISEFKKKNPKCEKNIMDNNRALRRLRTACERAKRTLSSSTQAFIEIDSLHEAIDFNLTLTRAKYEGLCADIFKACMEPVDIAMRDAKVSKSAIDEIVLVGGSSRIPKIQSLLSEYFNGKELNKRINPDEAVAYGATVQAANLTGDETYNMVLLDCTPLTIGIETNGRIMEPMIKRGTTIPCTKSKTFSTAVDHQPGVSIRIFEGERTETRHNNMLGEFNLDGIPPMPRGVPQIEVTYSVDANGILTVSAAEKSTGKSKNISVKNDKRFTDVQIEEMIKESEKFKEEDEKFKERFEARNKLENTIYGWKNELSKEEISSKLSEDDKTTFETLINETQEWLDSDEDEGRTKEDYDTKMSEVDTKIRDIAAKLYASGGDGTGNPADMSGMPGMYDTEGMAEMMKKMSEQNPDSNQEQTPTQDNVKVEEID